MGVTYSKLTVKKDTRKLLEKCIDEFRTHHPEFDEIPITQNKIIYEVCKFYLAQ